MLFVADADPWRWQPHPEVWLLIAGIFGLALYAVRGIGPKVVRDGSPIVTGRQKGWFFAGLLLLWAAADWPIHDIGEQHLYFVHMFQHMMFTMMAAPLFLLATPTWLARLVIGDGWFAGGFVRRLCHPIVAAILFNAAFLFVHWPVVVNASVQSAALHFSLHLMIFATALIMWMPVCGPLPELRLSLPGQMLYLFCQSIIPTLPSAWLIFAEKPLYSSYARLAPTWGIDAVNDQQIAGVIMKLGGGFFLWGVIAVLFFKWADRHEKAERAGIIVTERQVLTWDEVESELKDLERKGL